MARRQLRQLDAPAGEEWIRWTKARRVARATRVAKAALISLAAGVEDLELQPEARAAACGSPLWVRRSQRWPD